MTKIHKMFVDKLPSKKAYLDLLSLTEKLLKRQTLEGTNILCRKSMEHRQDQRRCLGRAILKCTDPTDTTDRPQTTQTPQTPQTIGTDVHSQNTDTTDKTTDRPNTPQTTTDTRNIAKLGTDTTGHDRGESICYSVKKSGLPHLRNCLKN